ncbi:hypothetical protein JCM15519_31530 [Fundidesulfovibrio butyratiphilus]
MLATLALSLAAKESIKTGLAMVLACATAMAMGWNNPYWACIAVAVVSLPSVGESLMKCLQRLWGTLAGGVAALVLLALFPQERWAFLILLSLYVGLCAYKITRGRYVYVWFLSGYVSLLIASSIIGTTSQFAFNTAVLRLQETALGVLAYTGVSMFVWPQRSTDDLRATVKTLLGAQVKILGNSFLLLRGRERDDPPGTWLDAADLLLGQLRRRLAASELEHFQVREMRNWWRRLAATFQSMTDDARGWRESAPDLRGLDMPDLVADIEKIQTELSGRMAALQAVFDGRPPGPMPRLEPRPDREKLAALPPLQRAAVKSTAETLRRLDDAVRALAECLLAITGLSRKELAAPAVASAPATPPPDRDSYAALARGVAGVLLASLVWIVADPPGHMAYVVFVGLFVLMGVLAPQMDWAQFFLVNMVGVVIAGLIYVLVMPSLTQFWQLAAVMFLLVAGVTYISWNPRLAALRLAGVVPFIMMTNLQNRQAYDFALFLNNCGAMVFGIVTVALVFHMPFGRRPERVIARLVARFFQRAEACMRDLVSDDDTRRRRGRASLASLQSLVGRIGGWVSRVDFTEVQAATPRDVARLVAGLNAIASGLNMIAKPRPDGDGPGPSGDRDMNALHEEILAMLKTLGAQCAPGRREKPSSEPAGGPAPDTDGSPKRTRDQVRDHTARDGARTFDERLDRTFHALCAPARDEEDCGAYRLLGGYRALRRALARYAELSAGFDWSRWNAARF